MAGPTLTVVFAIFPQVTQLDFTGPHQVLSRLPGAKAIIASQNGGPVSNDDGSIVFADTRALKDIEACDIICAPGGPGTNAALENQVYLNEIRRLALTAKWITSVCTGSLILGAAGLLHGKRAACHWGSREFLRQFGAIPDTARVVRDGNIMSGGGVTAGIDFALTLAAEIAGAEIAQAIQLGLEYAPSPPFNAGRPETTPDGALKRVNLASARVIKERAEAVERAAARLTHGASLATA